MRKFKRFAGIIGCAVMLSLSTIGASAEATDYTYTYDYWDEEQDSPNAYEINRTLTGSDFGIGNFTNPQGLFSRNDKLYVCDTDNNRIVVLKRNNTGFELDREIKEFDTSAVEGDVVNTFTKPYDVFVTVDEKNMYVADYGNQRVLKFDENDNLVQIFSNPKDETIPDDFKFGAQKIVVDATGRLYVMCESVNKGLMSFDPSGEFTGYIGATPVTYSLWDRFWKIFSTEEQKKRMANFVPTEYNNVALSTDGFFLVTTSVFEESELRSADVTPIRKLNSMGSDILIRNGYTQPMGDIQWGNAAGCSGSSKFVDVVSMENDTYYILDKTRCRIFAYDSQGNLLYAFGAPGNKEGYFQYPSAIEQNDGDLFVLDYQSATLTMFSLTEYGTLINEAIDYYQSGKYEESSDKWEEVLKYNGNYALGYIGIGRSLLRQNEYKESMEYFKIAYDFDNYSKAFKLYRKEWIEQNVLYLFIGLMVIICIPAAINKVKQIKREVEDIE